MERFESKPLPPMSKETKWIIFLAGVTRFILFPLFLILRIIVFLNDWVYDGRVFIFLEEKFKHK